MKKVLIGVIFGMILIGGLALSPLSEANASGQSEDINDLPGATANTTMADFGEIMNSILQQAGDEIRDSENAEFYRRLIQEFGISSLSQGTGANQPENQLPDIQGINQKALTLPLLEVRGQIRDKDIAEFYDNFLERAGWIVVPD